MPVVPVSTSDGPCAYVLFCEDERQAVLVDPEPAFDAAIAEIVESLGLSVVAVLHTRRAAEGTRGGQFVSLLSDLGLDAFGVGRTPIAGPTDAAPHVRPAASWQGDGEDEVRLLQVGDGIVEVTVDPRDELGSFVLGEPRRALRLTWGRFGVRYGRQRVWVQPIPDRPEVVAWISGDHLLTGAAVRAGTSVGGEHGTPVGLLSLPGHLVVHAGVIVDGVGVSTVALERRRAAALDLALPDRAGRAGPGTRAPVGEGLPDGPLDPRGFRSVEPAEAWACLERFMVVDVRDPREVAEGVPGARTVPMARLQAELGDEDRAVPVLVVCDTGTRSPTAAALLARMGFSKVFLLIGGMELWRESGLPLRAAAGLPTALNDTN